MKTSVTTMASGQITMISKLRAALPGTACPPCSSTSNTFGMPHFQPTKMHVRNAPMLSE